MSKNILLLILQAALICSTNAAANTAPTSRSAIEAEEYAVYSAVIRRLDPRNNSARTLIEAYTLSSVGNARSLTTLVARETLEDFNAKNRESYLLGRHFTVEREYGRILFTDQPEQLMMVIPEPVIAFSRVGFNPTMEQALVRVRYGRRGARGIGYRDRLVVLRKAAGGWQIVRTVAWLRRISHPAAAVAQSN